MFLPVVTSLCLLWQQDTFVTDRPDFTESANTIRRDWYQLETGFGVVWQTSGTGRRHSVALPYPLLRMGLTDRLELRVAADGFARTRFRDENGQNLIRGMSDFTVGFKYLLAQEQRVLPQLAVIASVNQPFGSRGLTSGTVDPTFKICWAKELPRGFEASGNVNASMLQEEGMRFLEKDVTFSLGHGLARGFKGYAEVYRMMTITGDRQNLNVFQSGWARQFGPRWQIDMSVARSFGGSTPRSSWTGGITYRAPFFGRVSN